METVFLLVAAICLLVSVFLAFFMTRTKGKRFLEPSNVLFFGVVVSAVLLFIPIYTNTFKDSDCGVIETVFISIHNMIRLFIVDGEFEFITSNLPNADPLIQKCYTLLFSLLFVLAPILTFGFVLSFFKNISAYRRYFSHFCSDVFIFSELNEKTVTLAKSLAENKEKKRFLVFTHVVEGDDEKTCELIDTANSLGAVCFKKDIVTTDFSFHSKKAQLNFFTATEDETKNVTQALKIAEKMKYRKNTALFVFSSQPEAELLLSGIFRPEEKKDGEKEAKEPCIKVRRINQVRSLVMHNLYQNGYKNLFASAREEEGYKKINALVIGMGEHGTEMTKALPWFCQMDGYRVEIHAFDAKKKAKEKFEALCPELMDEKYNGHYDLKGDAIYKIEFHDGVDFDSSSFDRALNALPAPTYIFVALGTDEVNTRIATKLRSFFARKGFDPVIQAVVGDTEKKEALFGISNFKSQEYKIDFIGDIGSSCSEDVILGSEVEMLALKRHTAWGSESDFWRYDYNYKSSVASAIHRKMKEKCEIPGIRKTPANRAPEELRAIRVLEHRRWNAYMRAEGYVYGGTIKKEGRNDLAKMHNCLVPFDELPPEEQVKDDD